MNKFDYNKYCMEQLFHKIPEINNLKGELKKDLDWHLKDSLITCILEEIVCPYFITLIQENNKKNIDIINRIVNLIEEWINHDNLDIRGIAEVSFIEALVAKLKQQNILKNTYFLNLWR